MPRSLLAHERAGRLEPVRLALRLPPEGSDGDGVLLAAPLSAGEHRLGDFEVGAVVRAGVSRLRFEVTVRNAGDRARRLDALVVGARWKPPTHVGLRYLKNGWQSWSDTGGRSLDDEGTPPFPSGPWLRGMHHGVDEPASDRAGWHESHTVSVVATPDSRAACLLGAHEQGRSFALIYARREEDTVRIEAELRFEVPLEPGEARTAEAVELCLGEEPSALLEQFAERWGREAGARVGSPFQAGWCSWYHFFHDVTEDDFLRNLEALAQRRDEIPTDVVQLDDGYQHAIGDWLETNEKFPRGLEPLARAVREAGFRAGLWTAPFCVQRESRLFQAHPEWLLQREGDFHKSLLHLAWSKHGWIHSLDATRAPVREHLEQLFRSLRETGFDYLKLDFLHAAAMASDASDPRFTRAERLRAGLEAIRRGAGEEAFLLGCGCPLGPAVGIVDGMRIGPDVAPFWEPRFDPPIPGTEPIEPSTRNALRSILTRAWMHRRLWLNDPDCLMARTEDTDLSPIEARALAVAIAATGGMGVFSDDMATLPAARRAFVADTLRLSSEVDAGGSRGTARAIGLLDEPMPGGVVGRTGSGALVAWINAADEPSTRELDAAALGFGEPVGPAQPLLGSPEADASAGSIPLDLAPHEGVAFRFARRHDFAVFCDFDGTFAVQDVGSTLARRHAGERRAELWPRLERGEFDAWGYNMELLDGLELPESELEAFLASVQLMPGAPELIQWCEARGVPFRILSDGFDYNLERLQALHGVHFVYEANHLHYENGAWRIAPAHPDSTCSCGTGTCKRNRIRAWREGNPGVRVVHVGNGRVSDLCATEAADLVFAKDTLAEELERRGASFEPFDDLFDVIRGLERL